MYIFVTAYPRKPLDVATSNFAGGQVHRSHDVEGTADRATFCVTLTPRLRTNNVLSCK